jgi:hypothetical protein
MFLLKLGYFWLLVKLSSILVKSLVVRGAALEVLKEVLSQTRFQSQLCGWERTMLENWIHTNETKLKACQSCP